MVFEQAVTIPENRKIHLDLELPKTVPSGAAFLRLIPVAPEGKGGYRARQQIPATMIASETSLAKTWDAPEEDAAWAAL